MLREMDVVRREEFEAVKAMAEKAREENERLEARIAALETQLGEVQGRFERQSFAPGATLTWTMPARTCDSRPPLFSSRRLVEFVALSVSRSFVSTTKRSPRDHQREFSSSRLNVGYGRVTEPHRSHRAAWPVHTTGAATAPTTTS